MKNSTPATLPIERRQQIFLAVVEAQDQGLSVAEARKSVSLHFDVPEAQVKAIETEGVQQQWPPL